MSLGMYQGPLAAPLPAPCLAGFGYRLGERILSFIVRNLAGPESQQIVVVRM